MQDWEPVPYDGNIQKFLNFLGNAEGADYNTIVGGKSFDSYDAHPNVVGLRTKYGPSTAAGKYQITNTTYNDVAPKLGITDFSPASQDRIAVELMKRNGALNDVQSGNFDAAINKLGGTWASLPSSQYNQPKRSKEWVDQQLAYADNGGWEPATRASDAGGNGGWTPAADGWEPVPKPTDENAGKPITGAKPAQKLNQQQLDAIYRQQKGLPPAQQPTQQAAPQDTFLGVSKKDIGHFIHGVGDTASFGFMDELAGKGADLLGYNGKDVTDFLRKDAQEGGKAMLAGQVAGAFIPGTGTIGAVRAVPTAGRLARAAAGAATGAIQGGLYGAGSADDGNRVEGATSGAKVGALGGGIISGLMPATVGQKVSDYVKKAGSEDNAALQAEIAQRVKTEFDNPARMVDGKMPEMTPKELNGKVVNSFLREGKAVIEQLPKDSPGKKQLQAALGRGLNNTTDELAALQSIPGGSEVADIINKATKADKMTSQVLQSPTMLAYGIRGLVNAVPPVVGGALGGPLGFATGAILDRYAVAPFARNLTGKMTKTEVGQNIVDKVSKLAEPVLDRTGPSQASQSLDTLQQMATKAQAGRQAIIAQQQAAKAQALAQQAAAKNQILQQTRMPSGGGFQELLNGGASGLNMSSKDAINALRTVSKAAKGTPVGDAAATMLKSQSVDNPEAFYGVQNMIRRLSEEGKVTGGVTTMPQGALSSGIRNPVSYEANVKNATEALKVAREAAPTPELAQFASSIGRIKGRADKAAAIEDRLANASDPSEVEYLTKLVKPLANFGKK